MRLSQTLLATLREDPAEAETVSHRLMLRAGLVRQLAAGIYSWLPLGLRVLHKVEQVVREEMNRTGAQEVLLPAVQPAELWQQSGRWDKYGPELLRLRDRHRREFCFGPTHEETITDLARRELRSYKQLPITFYQIQTKFRDEIRPRFGIMRAREFLMKDAYSFHIDAASLEETYQQMYQAYTCILTRLGLEFRAVRADSGNIGGNLSHEFHVLAEAGEDCIASSDVSTYAANLELVEVPAPTVPRPAASATLGEVHTPGQHSIAEVSAALKVSPEQCVKTLLVNGADEQPVAVVLRGDHELNRIKAERHPDIGAPLRLLDAAQVEQAAGCPPGSVGPPGLKLKVIADGAAAQLADFVCGANRAGLHLTGVNWGRDLPEPQRADLRNAVTGDPSPDGHGHLQLSRGIEVGHIFQLGTRYSAAMQAVCLNPDGKAVPLTMGCYGIGVSRLVAAAIEQHHDARGIIWPAALAPFQVILIPVNMHKSPRLADAVQQLYSELCGHGMEVLLDDRKQRPGVMYNDAELLGIPHWIICSERGLDQGQVEYRHRAGTESQPVALSTVAGFLLEQ